ncbi:MAG: AI-2E family transporter [Phycisphaeraceae bacterium]|nr:AI-2E family transporter [Phycisphaeraceae bacterium]
MHSDRHLWQFVWVRDLAILLVILAVFCVMYIARAIVSPVLLAAGMAYVFNPAVCWFHRRWRWPRWLTTALVLLIGLWVAMSLAIYIVPAAAAQGRQMFDDIGGFAQKHWHVVSPYIDRMAEYAGYGAPATTTDGDAATQPAATQPAVDAQTFTRLLDQARNMEWGNVTKIVMSSLGAGVGIVGATLGTMAYLALAGGIVLVCFFVFSWRFDAMMAWFVPLIPLNAREESLRIIAKMDRAVAAYVRGRLIQAAVMGIVLSIGWKLAGVPYWMLMGLVAAMLNLVPYAASLAWLSAVGLTVIHALGGPVGLTWGVFVWPSVAYFAAQSIDGWIVEPVVQGKATDLDPLTVMLVVILGGTLMGLLGMLLAIPTAACVRILMQEVVLPKWRAYAAGKRPS